MELAPGLFSIRQSGRRSYSSGYTQAYLLDDGNELTLIDTLADPDAHLIFEEFDRLGRRVSSLKNIVLTHAHRSHLGGLATLKRMSGATIWAHEWEADIIAGDRKAQPVTLLPKPPIRTLPQRIGLAAGVSARLPGRSISQRRRPRRTCASYAHSWSYTGAPRHVLVRKADFIHRRQNRHLAAT